MDKPVRILCGDAVEMLRSQPPNSVALTVTSPPYYLHRDYGVEGQIGQEPTLQEYLERIGRVLEEILRVTDDKGTCFVVVGDTYQQCRLLLVPHRVGISASDIGWTVRNDVIWHKTSPPPESPRNRWRWRHTSKCYSSQNVLLATVSMLIVCVPYAAATLRRWGSGQSYGGPKSKGRRSKNDSRMRDGQTFHLHPLGCLPIDVWSCASVKTPAGHYAAFPEELVRTIVEACSSPGELVLDPFAGLGTTCVVAASLGRRSIGIDLNPEYTAMAQSAADQLGSS